MPSDRVKVKVCGMTCVQNVEQVVDLGIDAVGMILHANSPRTINLQRARLIRTAVPAFVSLVGVFVDCDARTVNQMAETIQLDLIQLHGSESNQFGAALLRPFIKVIRPTDALHLQHELGLYPAASALLLDPYVEGRAGGTGQQLDHNLWPAQAQQKLILAGGLGPGNVAQACAALRPYAIDLNSGVESAPGIKDPARVTAVLEQLGR